MKVIGFGEAPRAGAQAREVTFEPLDYVRKGLLSPSKIPYAEKKKESDD
jgi:hypothetical protein